MTKLILTLLLLLLISPPAYGSKNVSNQAFVEPRKLPLQFIENKGQIHEKIKYYQKGINHTIFFTEEGVYFTFLRCKRRPKTEKLADGIKKDNDSEEIEVANLKLSFLGADAHPEIVGEDERNGKVNYLMGADPEKWKMNIPVYGSALYKKVYQ